MSALYTMPRLVGRRSITGENRTTRENVSRHRIQGRDRTERLEHMANRCIRKEILGSCWTKHANDLLTSAAAEQRYFARMLCADNLLTSEFTSRAAGSPSAVAKLQRGLVFNASARLPSLHACSSSNHSAGALPNRAKPV